jgi:hypothetical protein
MEQYEVSRETLDILSQTVFGEPLDVRLLTSRSGELATLVDALTYERVRLDEAERDLARYLTSPDSKRVKALRFAVRTRRMSMWQVIFRLARLTMAMCRDGRGEHSLQAEAADTGLTESEMSWLARFLHGRL